MASGSNDMRRRAAMDLEGVDEEGDYEEQMIRMVSRVKRYNRMAATVEAELRTSVKVRLPLRPSVTQSATPTHGDIEKKNKTDVCVNESVEGKKLGGGEAQVADAMGRIETGSVEGVEIEDVDAVIVRGEGEISPDVSPKTGVDDGGYPVMVVNGTEVIDIEAMSSPRGEEMEPDNLEGRNHRPVDIDWKAMCTDDNDPMLSAVPEEDRKLCVPEECRRRVGKDYIWIGQNDMTSLLYDRMLRDNVMDGFAIRLIERTKGKKLGHVILSTRFRDLLRTDVRVTKKNVRRKNYLYAKAERYFKKYDVYLYEKDAMLLPVNTKDYHWVLIILELKTKTMIQYDPMSLRRNPRMLQVIDDLKHWVYDEMKSLKAVKFANDNFKRSSWKDIYSRSFPRQMDGVSCGVSVLAVLEYLTRSSLGDERKAIECKMPFTEQHMTILRCRMTLAIKGGLQEWFSS